MNPIRYKRKDAVGKQKISSKYHQLVEKCNSLRVSINQLTVNHTNTSIFNI